MLLELLPWMLDKIICVALEIRNPITLPLESSLYAKNPMKLKGVIDLSLQSKTPSTRSSILRIVFDSNINFAPSTYEPLVNGTMLLSLTKYTPRIQK